jgi:hypothetical protein
MKEIDFLPEWYKSGRQRQIGYRAQVLGMGGVLLIMIVWNLWKKWIPKLMSQVF